MGQLIKKYNLGRIKASVWKNSHEKAGRIEEYYVIRFSKAFKKPDSQKWEYTDSLFANDLKDLSVLADEIYKKIKLKEYDGRQNNNNPVKDDKED